MFSNKRGSKTDGFNQMDDLEEIYDINENIDDFSSKTKESPSKKVQFDEASLVKKPTAGADRGGGS